MIFWICCFFFFCWFSAILYFFFFKQIKTYLKANGHLSIAPGLTRCQQRNERKIATISLNRNYCVYWHFLEIFFDCVGACHLFRSRFIFFILNAKHKTSITPRFFFFFYSVTVYLPNEAFAWEIYISYLNIIHIYTWRYFNWKHSQFEAFKLWELGCEQFTLDFVCVWISFLLFFFFFSL